jgi:RNA polymerase sigma-70 factor, ECF subfamily
MRTQQQDRRADQALVGRMKARDESALGELSRTYGSRIQQLAFRYTRNREDAEEIAQDVLLKVYRKIDSFRGDAALSSWIYRITFNTAMSRLRRQKQQAKATQPEQTGRETFRDGLPARPREPADWSSLADEAIMRAELRQRLAAALRELPTIYRLPIVLRDINGLSTEEASTALRVKDQTLKSRLHRGRMILRDRLSDFAGGLSLYRVNEETAAINN